MTKSHVLHIRDSSGIYGGERVILTLAKGMNSKGSFKVSLLCMKRQDGRSGALIAAANRTGINVQPVDVGSRLDFSAIKQIRKYIRENNVSIIHTHDFKSDFYGFLATRNLSVKRVATAHGSTRDSLLKRLYLYFDEHFVYRFYDRIIAVSDDLQSQLTDKRIPMEKIAVIQNGLDVDLLNLNEWHVDPAMPFKKKPDKKIFAVIGRLYPDKGQMIFLRAFADIADDHPESYAMIVGDGPDRENLVNAIKTLGLKDRVFYCGVIKDIKIVYNNIDYLVIPSLTEGLPYVLLEAMALNIPVLATAVGDIPLLIQEGSTGMLVPPGDSAAMALKMKNLLSEHENIQKMTDAAKRLIEEKYSAKRMVEQTESLYASLLS